MKPTETEPICLVSFEIARIRLGGGPDERPSFWKVYREEQELNQKTGFRNEHVRICWHHLVSPRLTLEGPVYFRQGRLVMEREIDGKEAPLALP